MNYFNLSTQGGIFELKPPTSIPKHKREHFIQIY